MGQSFPLCAAKRPGPLCETLIGHFWAQLYRRSPFHVWHWLPLRARGAVWVIVLNEAEVQSPHGLCSDMYRATADTARSQVVCHGVKWKTPRKHIKPRTCMCICNSFILFLLAFFLPLFFCPRFFSSCDLQPSFLCYPHSNLPLFLYFFNSSITYRLCEWCQAGLFLSNKVSISIQRAAVIVCQLMKECCMCVWVEWILF